jgi:hypothetical protein
LLIPWPQLESVVSELSFADSDDFSKDRLLGRRVRNRDAAGRFALLCLSLDDEPVVQGLTAVSRLRSAQERANSRADLPSK